MKVMDWIFQKVTRNACTYTEMSTQSCSKIREFLLPFYELLRAEKVMDLVFNIFRQYFVRPQLKNKSQISVGSEPLKALRLVPQLSLDCHMFTLDFRCTLNFKIRSKSEQGSCNKEHLAYHLSLGILLPVVFLSVCEQGTGIKYIYPEVIKGYYNYLKF